MEPFEMQTHCKCGKELQEPKPVSCWMTFACSECFRKKYGQPSEPIYGPKAEVIEMPGEEIVDALVKQVSERIGKVNVVESLSPAR